MFGRLVAPVCVLSLLAFPCLGQTQDAPPSQAPATTMTPAATNAHVAPPKKVWTNEDITGTKGGVSVIGDKRNQNYHLTPNQPADPATVARIKKELEKLQTQLDDVNMKLKSFKEFQDGEPVSTGERDLSKGINRVPVNQQVAQLEDKKKTLQGQIGDLVDEARKKGVDPGQLR
jgi:hypothetical protein